MSPPWSSTPAMMQYGSNDGGEFLQWFYHAGDPSRIEGLRVIGYNRITRNIDHIWCPKNWIVA